MQTDLNMHGMTHPRAGLEHAVHGRGGWYRDRHALWATVDMPSSEVQQVDEQVYPV